jgi:hypothetical protein
MIKLLAAYAACPTLNAAIRVRNYGRKHPFASCLLSFEDSQVLDNALRHINAHAERTEQAAYEAEITHYGSIK